MTPARCIGEPVSWLRLEQLALGELPAPTAAAVTAHLGACPACAACLDQIQDDHVELPALPAAPPAPAPWWRRRWTWGVAGALAAAAAVLLVVVIRPRDATHEVGDLSPRIRVKGAGEIVVGLVRERGGTTTLAPTGFRRGDRFEVIVTCGEAADVWADIAVYQPAERGGPMVASYPAPPVRLACGNHVVLPGAFTITGAGAASVCLAIDVDHAPTRDPLGRKKGVACYQLVPE